MKKYEYVSVHIGKLVGAKSEEHRHIIDEYAKKVNDTLVAAGIRSLVILIFFFSFANVSSFSSVL